MEARRVLISKWRIKKVCDEARERVESMQAAFGNSDEPVRDIGDIGLAKAEAENLDNVAAALEHPDKQNVPTAQWVFNSPTLQRKLYERGWRKDAHMLRVPRGSGQGELLEGAAEEGRGAPVHRVHRGGRSATASTTAAALR